MKDTYFIQVRILKGDDIKNAKVIDRVCYDVEILKQAKEDFEYITTYMSL